MEKILSKCSILNKLVVFGQNRAAAGMKFFVISIHVFLHSQNTFGRMLSCVFITEQLLSGKRSLLSQPFVETFPAGANALHTLVFMSPRIWDPPAGLAC